jgi:hypothetical protein
MAQFGTSVLSAQILLPGKRPDIVQTKVERLDTKPYLGYEF